MTKQELIQKAALNAGVNQDTAANVVNGLLTAISDALACGDDIRIVGFGTFGTKARKQRMGRNPKTGKEVVIPAKTVAYFKPGKTLNIAASTAKGKQ